MRKLLLLLLVLVGGVVALGWYLEWFHFGITRQRTPARSRAS
jgi:hypothetical protein